MSEHNKESEDLQSKFDEMFSRKVGIEALAGIPPRAGWYRKGVITNYPANAGPDLVRNYDNHRKFGYTVVISTETLQDDRLFSPNSQSRVNNVPGPLSGKTSDGYEYVIMEIEETKLLNKFKDREKVEHEKYLQSVNKVNANKSETIVKDHETKF